MRLLAVNAGSTSIKVTVTEDGARVATYDTLDAGLAGDGPVDAVVHRVVHGGARTTPVVIDDRTLAELRALTPLAPLHQPPALDAIDRCRAALPHLAHVACFDTAFHATISHAARTYALPERLRQLVRAYGFHGLSHAWSSSRIAALAPAARRLLIAHLGGGQSLCAVLDGRSVATTMGFTPLDGLVMATRSGAIDPGALLYLAERTSDDLSSVLEQESGLLGLCGSDDMAEVVRRSDAGDAEATFALDVWTERFVRQAGSCIAAMGGLDALVFTGGVGEHSPDIRRRVANRLGWLGVEFAGDHHAAGDVEITASGSPVRTFVVAAAEDLTMSADAAQLLGR